MEIVVREPIVAVEKDTGDIYILCLTNGMWIGVYQFRGQILELWDLNNTDYELLGNL